MRNDVAGEVGRNSREDAMRLERPACGDAHRPCDGGTGNGMTTTGASTFGPRRRGNAGRRFRRGVALAGFVTAAAGTMAVAVGDPATAPVAATTAFDGHYGGRTVVAEGHSGRVRPALGGVRRRRQGRARSGLHRGLRPRAARPGADRRLGGVQGRAASRPGEDDRPLRRRALRRRTERMAMHPRRGAGEAVLGAGVTVVGPARVRFRSFNGAPAGRVLPGRQRTRESNIRSSIRSCESAAMAADALDADQWRSAAWQRQRCCGRADDPGGHRPASRRQPCQRLPVGCRSAGAGPTRAARPTANRAAAAARRPSLVTARPAAGQGCGGSGFRNRALDPEAHRGVDPAGVRRALPPALPRASPEGARLLGPAPRDPGQGAR